MEQQHYHFMQIALDLSLEGMRKGEGGPFGAVVVKDGQVVGRGNNQVLLTKDPTAHAEVVAIRNACRQLGHYQLDGCIIYTSCEPCPMCMGAIYWARPEKVYFANTKQDAANIAFDDQFIYRELELPLAERRLPMIRLEIEGALNAFLEWQQIHKGRVY